MATSITPFQLYIGMIISGVLTGVGISIGMYFANKYLVKQTERMIKKLERQVNSISTKIKRVKKKNKAKI